MKSKAVGILASVLLLGAIQTHAAPVIVGDREWLQPVDFVNLSWNDINAVCNATAGGACSGSLAGTVLDGYTWAGVDEMKELFNSFIAPNTLGPFNSFVDSPDSVWASEFISAEAFQATRGGARLQSVFGWTRTATSFETRVREQAFVTDCIVVSAVCSDDRAVASSGAGIDNRTLFVGAWFYREIAQVPEPGTLALLGLGLVGMGYSRRRKAA
jgi:hypothetical protein